MSKFDFALFYGGYDSLAVSKEKYSKNEAIEIARRELCYHNHKYLAVGDGYVRHRAGVNEDYEPCVGWWLEYSKHKRSCPCYVFHTVNTLEPSRLEKHYEHIKLYAEEV